MADILEKLNSLKDSGNRELSSRLDEIKRAIDGITIDTGPISTALHTALMSIFNTQNGVEQERSNRLKEDLQRFDAKISAFNDAVATKESINGLLQTVEGIKAEINLIPKTDLSGVEKSIKSIKPTDVTKIEKMVNNLSILIKDIKMPEIKTDLKPVISAINKLNKPKRVEFEVISDAYGYPQRVVATEVHDGDI